MRRKTWNGVLWRGYHRHTRWTSSYEHPLPAPSPSFLILPKWCNGCEPEVCRPTGPSFPTVHWFTAAWGGGATSSAAWGWPPDAQLNMLSGRDRRGENRVFAVPHLSCWVRSVRLPFLLRPGSRTESRKRFQLAITLITIAQNKSQAEKSLDGNCYNCPNNGNGYFSPLNYTDLIFKYTICQFSPVELGSNRFKYLNHSH